MVWWSIVFLKAEALTAVGNIILDFSPQKTVIMQSDGIIQLIQLAQSMDPSLRRNAVLALKNLLFLADNTVKHRVMTELTVSTLCELIRGKSARSMCCSFFGDAVRLKQIEDGDE